MTRAGAPGRMGWLIGLAFAGVFAAAAPLRAEPVEDLRLELLRGSVSNPTVNHLVEHDQRLKVLVEKLQTIGDHRRALVLTEWADDPLRDGADERIREGHRKHRTTVGKMLEKLIIARAKVDNVTDRAALANLIAEMGPSVRALNTLNPKDADFSLQGYTRTLLPVVQQLSKDADLGVRLEALRAVSNINAVPQVAAGILADVFKDGGSLPAARRVAADGLGQMVRVTSYLSRLSGASSGVTARPAEVLQTVTEVIQASAICMKDTRSKGDDPIVRKYSADAFQAAAAVLDDLIPKLMQDELNPLTGDLDPIAALPKAVKKLTPTLATIKRDLNELTPLLSDGDVRVRQSAAEALVEVAAARQRFCLMVVNVSELAPAQRQELLAADPLQNFLSKDLSAIDRLAASEDAPLRKSAATFMLHAAVPLLADKDANPIASRVRVGLNDSETATRFIAARALGNLLRDKRAAAIDPAIIKKALPDLQRLLSDTNLWVRIATAETLQGIGAGATATAEAVALAAKRGDAEGRIAALKALNEFKLDLLSAQDQQRVVEPLVEVLGQRDAADEVLAAVSVTLGQIGPVAKSALPALRRLLNHDDSIVRSAVSEAILAINR